MQGSLKLTNYDLIHSVNHELPSVDHDDQNTVHDDQNVKYWQPKSQSLIEIYKNVSSVNLHGVRKQSTSTLKFDSNLPRPVNILKGIKQHF